MNMSEQLYKTANPNGAAGANPNQAQAEDASNNEQNGNVYDADYKVENDEDKK